VRAVSPEQVSAYDQPTSPQASAPDPTRTLISQASGVRRTNARKEANEENELEWDSANDLGNSTPSLAAAVDDSVRVCV
jgi:hypothetical protein